MTAEIMYRRVDESGTPESWKRLDELMMHIAAAEEPYWLGIKVLSCLAEALTASVVASGLYQLWGDLTDRYEAQSEDERDETRALMRQAASEWLGVKGDDVARDTYLDRWVARPD